MGTDGLVDHLGEEFTDFELAGLGGSGRVYRARQVTLGRSVAVKVLRSPVIGERVDAVDEAKAQAAVSWHANVLTIHAHGVSPDGWAYRVLEDAEGGSLKERVDKEGPLSPDDAMEMLGQLASALAAAHEIGVVHCDVKPSNVLFAKDGSVRLADFGTALSSTTQTLDFLEGSLVFAPPELLEGRRPGPANDVYGMAVTILYGLSGEVPFGGGGQHAAAVIARIHSEDIDFSGLGLPDVVASLLDRCGTKDPRDRPGADEVTSVLQEWRTSGFGADDTPSTRSSRHNELRRVLEKSLADRSAVMQRIAAMAITGASAVELARSLCQDLAWESAQAIKPLVDLAARDCPEVGGRTLSIEQLHHLVVSQTAAELAGHPSIHGDGILSMNGAAVPSELMHVAETFDTVMHWATRQCPDVAIDMGPIHRERSTALLAAPATGTTTGTGTTGGGTSGGGTTGGGTSGGGTTGGGISGGGTNGGAGATPPAAPKPVQTTVPAPAQPLKVPSPPPAPSPVTAPPKLSGPGSPTVGGWVPPSVISGGVVVAAPVVTVPTVG